MPASARKRPRNSHQRELLPYQRSTVAKLPPELIVMIVQLGEEDLEADRSGNFTALASRVCSWWRAVVLDAHSLWSHIRISNLPSGIPNLSRASAFVARSSNCPLRVAVDAAPASHGPAGPEGTQTVATAISEFLAPHAHRIKQFHLDYTPQFIAEEVAMMIPGGAAPLLESLSIGCLANWIVEPFVIRLLQPPHEEAGGAHNAVEYFPNLKSLILSWIAPAWSHFPSQTLTKLQFSNLSPSVQPTWSQLHAILRANAATLESFILSGGLPEGPSSGIPTILSVLIHLNLAYSHPIALQHFMAIAQTPHLKSLFLRDLHGTGIEDPNETSAPSIVMEHIPMHQLRILYLSEVGFTAPLDPLVATNPHAREFFSRLHALETLTFIEPEPEVLEALSYASPDMTPGNESPRPTLPAPQLSRLFLQSVYADTLGDLIDALTLRESDQDAALSKRQLSQLTLSLSGDGWEPTVLEKLLDAAKAIANVVHCARWKW